MRRIAARIYVFIVVGCFMAACNCSKILVPIDFVLFHATCLFVLQFQEYKCPCRGFAMLLASPVRLKLPPANLFPPGAIWRQLLTPGLVGYCATKHIHARRAPRCLLDHLFTV